MTSSEKIKEGLIQFKKLFNKVLEDDASQVIDEAVAELEASKQLYDKSRRRTDNPKLQVRPWGYKIRPEKPLRFKTSNALAGFPVHPDLFCDIAWKNENDPPTNQTIQVRLWSTEMAHIHRNEWDAEGIIDRIVGNKRVMLRFHLDLAESSQEGPRYHLQFGGRALDEEVCWFPEIISLPRINFSPMDLILAGQLIAANFFRDEYLSLRKTPEWISIIRASQQAFLQGYYTRCIDVLRQDGILLDALWNLI